MKVHKDGNMWCITADDFNNLQDSDAVFVTEREYERFLLSILEKISGKPENGEGMAYTLAQMTMPNTEKSIRDRFRKEMRNNLIKIISSA